MKRLRLIVVMIILLAACSKPAADPPAPQPPQPLEVETEATETTAVETDTETTRPEVKPKELTYTDHKNKILDQLAYMRDYETKTDILVEASGGSFLMPGFEVIVDKSLNHQQRPLETRARIDTTGPFFLNLGPARREIYTEGGEVFSYDEAKNRFVKDSKIRPNQVLEQYDAETQIQQKLWRDYRMDLTTGHRLIAKLTLEGEEARGLIDEVFLNYGIAFEFDDKLVTEEVEMIMEYDPETYFPQTMAIEGVTRSNGYDLAIEIDVVYRNVK